MSVWENAEALFQFVYQSNHVEILKRRKEWFEKMSEMHMALWYIPAGNLPTVAEATERLTYLRNNGETPFSFSFKKRFTLCRSSRVPCEAFRRSMGVSRGCAREKFVHKNFTFIFMTFSHLLF